MSTREQQKTIFLEACLFGWLGIIFHFKIKGGGSVASEGSRGVFEEKNIQSSVDSVLSWYEAIR